MTVPASECLALISLYSGTNGADWLYNPTWDNHENWLQTLDVDSWFGVRTSIYSGQEHVDGLFLHKTTDTNAHGDIQALWQGIDMEGSLPTSLSNLTYLKDFNITNNNVDGTLPDISYWTKAEYIYADNNNLIGTLPTDLSTLTNLVVLRLANNALTSTLPITFGTTPVLEQLYLQ